VRAVRGDANRGRPHARSPRVPSLWYGVLSRASIGSPAPSVPSHPLGHRIHVSAALVHPSAPVASRRATRDHVAHRTGGHEAAQRLRLLRAVPVWTSPPPLPTTPYSPHQSRRTPSASFPSTVSAPRRLLKVQSAENLLRQFRQSHPPALGCSPHPRSIPPQRHAPHLL
jgi:hypothetical protein